MTIESIRAVITAIVAMPEVQAIAAGVFLNAALAIAAAIRTGDFTFRVVGAFLKTQLLPSVIVYAGARIAGDGLGLGALAPAVLAFLMAEMLARIVESLRMLGLPVPEPVQRVIGRRPQLMQIVRKAE